VLPKLVLDAAGKVRTRLHRGDGASVHGSGFSALRLGDCCEGQGGQSDAPAQQSSEIRCRHLHRIEPRRQLIADAGYGIGDAGNSSSSNTRVLWKAQPCAARSHNVKATETATRYRNGVVTVN